MQFDAGEIPQVEDDTAITIGDRFKLAAEDLKMFYAEAVMEQPNPGTATQIQQWFWHQTQAGELLFRLAEQCAKHECQTRKQDHRESRSVHVGPRCATR